MPSLELTKSNIAESIAVSETSLEPFDLNLMKVTLLLDEYTNCFPSPEEYDLLEDDSVMKKLYFKAIILQWEYMIDNAEMYNPAEVLIGQRVGRHSYNGITSQALRSFSRWNPIAVGLLERNGLTCNSISITDTSPCGMCDL